MNAPVINLSELWLCWVMTAALMSLWGPTLPFKGGATFISTALFHTDETWSQLSLCFASYKSNQNEMKREYFVSIKFKAFSSSQVFTDWLLMESVWSRDHSWVDHVEKWLDKGHKVGMLFLDMVQNEAQFSVHFVKKKRFQERSHDPGVVCSQMLCSSPWSCCRFIIRPPHSEDTESSKFQHPRVCRSDIVPAYSRTHNNVWQFILTHSQTPFSYAPPPPPLQE